MSGLEERFHSPSLGWLGDPGGVDEGLGGISQPVSPMWVLSLQTAAEP